MKSIKLITPVSLIVLLCLVSRLPQLVSPLLVLDGDEALVGLMAKHLFEGKELTLYFWGQAYGFTLIELLFIVPFYALLGVNTLAVKLAMLTLWSIGVVFLYKAMTSLKPQDRLLPLILTILFISFPAWAVWSMKARGGYLSAFTLSSVVLFLLFRPARNFSLRYGIIGVLTTIIYESQAFWLVAIFPLICYQMFSLKKIKPVLTFSTCATAIYLLLRWYKLNNVQLHYPRPFFPKDEQMAEYAARFPEYLFSSLHGTYFFSNVEPPNFFAALAAGAACLLTTLIIVAALYLLFTKRTKYPLFLISSASILAFYGYSFLTEWMEGRYLLPVSGWIVFTLFLLLLKKPLGKALKISLLTIAIIGLVAVSTFYSFDPPRIGKISSITMLLNRLKQNKVSYVFSADCMLPYQLMFYSNENVIARIPYPPGRYPPYMTQVDSAWKAGARVAVVGMEGVYHGLDLPVREGLDEFFLQFDPSPETLKQLFIFTKNPSTRQY